MTLTLTQDYVVVYMTLTFTQDYVVGYAPCNGYKEVFIGKI